MEGNHDRGPSRPFKVFMAALVAFTLYVLAWQIPYNQGPIYVTTPEKEQKIQQAGLFSHLLMDITPPAGRTIFSSFGYGGRWFTQLCNADCTTQAANTCASGTALASITDSAPDTKPYSVSIAAGVYPECVGIEEQSGITIRGAGVDATVLRPAVTNFDDIDGGVLRVTKGSETRSSVLLFEDMTIHDDAYSVPEGAVTIGGETCTDDPATWDRVTFNRVKMIGAYGGLYVCGGRADDPNGVEIPRLQVRNSTIIGGRVAAVRIGDLDALFQGTDILSISNYCETADETFLGEVTGTAGAAIDNRNFSVESADDPNIDDFFGGRRVVFSAGTCAAGGQGWIQDYDEVTAVATYDPNTAFTVDATCTYTIDAVPHYDEQPCRDIDWTVIAETAGNGYSNAIGFNISGVSGNFTSSSLLDFLQIRDSRVSVEVNDYGPGPSITNCTSKQSGRVCGVLAAGKSWGRKITVDADVSVEVNVDQADDNLCEWFICGVGIGNTPEIEDSLVFTGNVRIDSDAEEDADVAGIVVDNGGANALMVVPRAFVDLNMTHGSYSGTAAHLAQLNSGVLNVGDLVSDAPIVTSGTIGHLGAINAGLTGTNTLDFASAASGACSADLTITVTGAVDGDLVDLGVPNGSVTAGGSMFQAWVNAADTVTVRHCCEGAGPCDPASGTYTARVKSP